MRSTIFARSARLYLLAALALLLAGCGTNKVVVKGEFPSPVLEKLPITLGVYYSPEFRNHSFHDEGSERNETEWIVESGQSQVKMYNILLNGMFEKIVLLNDIPRRDRVEAVGEENVQAVLVPSVEELQYAIPRHTKINVFEIWLRYRYQLYDPQGDLLADWTMTSYGKTPTAFLQSAEGAVNLAAVVALRDAGANFAMNFSGVPEVKMWMDALPGGEVPAEPGPATEELPAPSAATNSEATAADAGSQEIEQ